MVFSDKMLYITGLCVLVAACSTQGKNVKKNNSSLRHTQSTAISQGQEVNKLLEKPALEHIGAYDFYKVNISNPQKNDNTISYGSIVGADPKPYKVTKTYFPSMGQNFRQRYIILHYTALDNEKSLRVLTQQSVSSHYLVNDLDDQEIYQLVDENKRAYHAGISYWRKNENLNDTSIGIEIVNTGYITDSEGRKQFYPYPEWQFRKVAFLVKDIATRYQIPATHILAHSDIAPTRKQDPGPLFPWKRLYDEYGIGMWYDETTKFKYLSSIEDENFEMQRDTAPFIFRYQTLLNQLGYRIELNGIYDDATKKTIEAFQYRFRPEDYSGIMDAETFAVLQALLEKYPNK